MSGVEPPSATPDVWLQASLDSSPSSVELEPAIDTAIFAESVRELVQKEVSRLEAKVAELQEERVWPKFMCWASFEECLKACRRFFGGTLMFHQALVKQLLVCHWRPLRSTVIRTY